MLGEVTHQNIYGQDVTEQHTDLQLRLDNARQSRQRYLQLLEKAEEISDILLIEKELERLLYDIESLQGQLNQLDVNHYLFYHHCAYSGKNKAGGRWDGFFVGLWEGLRFLFVWD